MSIKSISKNKWVWVAAIAVIVATVVWFRNNSLKSSNNIDSATIKRGQVRREIILTGQIKAIEHAQLKFLSSGELSWIGVKEGDWVKKGQYLAKLNTAILQSQYEQALADLRKTQAALDKVLDEVKGHDNDETLDQRNTRTAAEVNRDKAYRAVEIAKQNLNNSYLKAPFAGLITKVVLPFSGINTNYNQPQIEILNPNTIYFEVQSDQTEVKDLKLGQTVFIVLDSYPDQEIPAAIKEIARTPSPGEPGTVYQVKVGFNNIDAEKYMIGMTGDASFILETKEDVLYIPPKYLNSDKLGRYVKLKPKNSKVYVNVGISGEKRVEIEGNIKEGDTVYD